MPLTIRYTDTRNQHETTCDAIQEEAIRALILKYLAGPWPFDDQFQIIHIDLTDECVETVNCYSQSGTRTCSFGGAVAWNIYCCIGAIWPEINHHACRPAVIL